jgi:hypothetical protein
MPPKTGYSPLYGTEPKLTFSIQLLQSLLELSFEHVTMGSVDFSQTSNHCDDWAQHLVMLVGHEGPELYQGMDHRVKKDKLVASVIVILLRELGREEDMMEQIQACL